MLASTCKFLLSRDSLWAGFGQEDMSG